MENDHLVPNDGKMDSKRQLSMIPCIWIKCEDENISSEETLLQYKLIKNKPESKPIPIEENLNAIKESLIYKEEIINEKNNLTKLLKSYGGEYEKNLLDKPDPNENMDTKILVFKKPRRTKKVEENLLPNTSIKREEIFEEFHDSVNIHSNKNINLPSFEKAEDFITLDDDQLGEKYFDKIETKQAEKYYSCKLCKKKIKSKLNRHLQIHTGNRPFECNHCGNRFRDKNGLKTHVRIHTGERPHECTHCGKRFNYNYDLQKHFRIHTGEKPYECSYCKKKFTIRHSLRRHCLTHTGEKPWECDHCGKRYRDHRSLKFHLEQKHKKS